ncbi:lantibiotic dehydratase [Hymenobacter metallicola]|uniref:Lantibiotic dehydratase n=1 Tax=Hymenobacter metallicola TaxID=2563114 RepID=A0A4Z0QEF2_9BACT|nr:lantibiotic dehydratase [Hymenobacter metallicola]TGE28115.1 hypothetical protein E5K02_01225 [Hymenobacter metallicola]
MNNVPLEFIDEVIVRSPVYTYREKINSEDVLVLLEDSFFMEAIYIASPLLHDECVKLKEGRVKTSKEKTKIVNSLYRYITRMTTRSTPFGLFSTCGVAIWGDSEGKETQEIQRSRARHTRLDMHLLYTLVTPILLLPDVQKHLKYFPNSSHYTIGSEVRYIEYTYKYGLRKYKISGVTRNKYIDIILGNSRGGLSRGQMVGLITACAISREQSEQFVDDLIQSQLLVSDFEVALTSKVDFAEQIQKHLQELYDASGSPEIHVALNVFSEIIQDVKNLDHNKVNDVRLYRNIIQKMRSINPRIEESKAFHIDSYQVGAKPVIEKKHQDELIELLQYLKSLNAGARDVNDHLESFKKKFVHRYDSQAILLADVLDNDYGIGYPINKRAGSAPLVDDIPFNVKVRDSHFRLDAKEKWLLTILRERENKDAYSIALDKQKLPTYNQDDSFRDVPATLSAMFRLLNDEDKSILFEGFFGPSGVSVLGRFAHGNPEIGNIVERVVAAEEKALENCVFAELVHMPDNRITNIIKHPVFRKYEIPYLAKSSVEDDFTIGINDLFVKVENNEIILFSKRLNKRIIPCKSHMHNHYTNSLPLYHFLGDLQSQGMDRSINFTWGSLMQLYSFLPRVSYKNMIVSPAMWYLNQNVLEQLSSASSDSLLTQIELLREQYKLPVQVLYSEGDNELLVDFSNLTSVEVWLSLVKSKKAALLKEFLWASNTQEHSYLHQYIATLVTTEKRTFSTPILSTCTTESVAEVQRDFPIGSEWLYLKLYCGPGSADILLSKLITPLVKSVLQQELVDKWFFIKYRDPEFHIRLRLHLKDASDSLKVLALLQQGIQQSRDCDLIWKIQPETYSREIERYGSRTMEVCESVFFIDSAVTVELLNAFSGDKNEVLRSIWSLRLIDDILNACGFALEQKSAFVEVVRKSFQQEFDTNKHSMNSINAKYTTYKALIQEVMSEGNRSKHAQLMQLLDWKSNALAPLMQHVMRLHNDKSLEVDLFHLLSSIIHMMLNRLITHKERTHELLVYEFLHKFYTTQRYVNKVSSSVFLHTEAEAML